jgi:hypothetical protein
LATLPFVFAIEQTGDQGRLYPIHGLRHWTRNMDYKGDDTSAPVRSDLNCSHCGSPARLVRVFPLLLTPGTDAITYRCESCGIEFRLHVSSGETGGERAPEYRIYALGAGGQISGVRIFACADDAQAIQKAQQAANGHHVVELWKRDRLIKQIVAKPED